MQTLKGYTKKQFFDLVQELTDEQKEWLWNVCPKDSYESVDLYDYASDCSMCGKPMKHSDTGRCSSCDQVWNS